MEIDRLKETESTVATSPRSASWKRWVAVGTLAAVGVTGLGLTAAQSQGFGCGMMGGPQMMRGFMDDRGIPGRRLGYILDAIKATPEQSEKIKAIMTKAREDMGAAREGFLNTRDQFAEVLGAPTIDRAAVEKLRADRVQAMDDASKKMTAALLDAAEVLSPEQRTQLLQHFKERRAFQRW